MKLDYDIELNILEDIHELDYSQCIIFSDKDGSSNYLVAEKIIKDILNGDYLNKWKDNTASQFPPDFINEEDSLIMEVMRIDDHSSDGKKNPNLSKQRSMSKKIEMMRNKMSNTQRCFMNVVTDLPTDEDHNYKNYYSSFQRTIKKHLSKLEKYKNNYPNKKTIFLVVDESSGIYVEAIVRNDMAVVGMPHLVFLDRRFINEFIDSDLDYLIFYCPYKNFKTLGGCVELPKLIIFDIKNMKLNDCIPIHDYDESKMISSEK